MSNVNLAIGGRSFAVACASGEERHIVELGRMIGAIAQNETRMLLFAALMLADEVHEVRAQLSQGDAASAQLEQRVAQISHRLESLASHLEEIAP